MARPVLVAPAQRIRLQRLIPEIIATAQGPWSATKFHWLFRSHRLALPLATARLGPHPVMPSCLAPRLASKPPQPATTLTKQATYLAGSGLVHGNPSNGGRLVLCRLFMHSGRGLRHAWFPDLAGAVLWLEDIDEQPYAIDRDLWQLYHGGHGDLAGMAWGRFHTKNHPEVLHASLADLAQEWSQRLQIPVWYDLPFGHGGRPLTGYRPNRAPRDMRKPKRPLVRWLCSR